MVATSGFDQIGRRADLGQICGTDRRLILRWILAVTDRSRLLVRSVAEAFDTRLGSN
jgi:hypothetical protein